jgi:hypothetical protein
VHLDLELMSVLVLIGPSSVVDHFFGPRTIRSAYIQKDTEGEENRTSLSARRYPRVIDDRFREGTSIHPMAAVVNVQMNCFSNRSGGDFLPFAGTIIMRRELGGSTVIDFVHAARLGLMMPRTMPRACI